MTSHHLSSCFLLLLAFVLLLSPQTQAREGKFFSFFSHYTTSHNKLKSHPPSPSPSPSPSSESIAATPESILAVPAPAPAPESTETAPAPSPAESGEFVDRGDGYGLYGTTSFGNNNDNRETFKTRFGTELYSNYNNNNNEEEYTNNYNYNNNNEEEYTNSYNNNREYYNNNHRSNNYYADSYYSNNNNDNRYSYSYNNNNGDGNNNKNNHVYYSNNGYNGYEREREGMSDTRFVENGKYFYDVKGENQNYNHYNVEGYEPTGRSESTTESNNYGGSYYENNNNYYRKYPKEFDTMEEYEKQQENQRYMP